MKRNRHDHIDVREHTDLLHHPLAEGPPQRSAGPVLELVDRFPERTFELSDRQGLVEQRRFLSACPAFKLGAVAQSFRRFKGSAAARADRPAENGKIPPAGRAKIRDGGITDWIFAKGTEGRKDDIKNPSKDIHRVVNSLHKPALVTRVTRSGTLRYRSE